MSRPGRVTTTLTAIAWAVAGVLAGHALTYALLFPEAHRHDEVLSASGHAWLDLLWPVMLVAVAVAVVIGFLSGSSSGGSRGVRFVALATVQVALFAGLELAERLTAGLTFAGLLHELVHHGLAGILIVGGLIQLLAAWIGSAASRMIRAMAERLRRPAFARRAATHQSLPEIHPSRSRHADTAHAIRGPPSAAVATHLPHQPTTVRA